MKSLEKQVKETDKIIHRAFELLGLSPIGIIENEFVTKNGFMIWYFYRFSSLEDYWNDGYNKITIRYELSGKYVDKNISLKNITTEKVIRVLKSFAGKYL